MKKAYEAPVIEPVKFEYRDQVVAASGTGTFMREGRPSVGYCEETPTPGQTGGRG